MRRIFATLALALAVASPIAALASSDGDEAYDLAEHYSRRCHAADQVNDYVGIEVYCQDAAEQYLIVAADTTLGNDGQQAASVMAASMLYVEARGLLHLDRLKDSRSALHTAHRLFNDVAAATRDPGMRRDCLASRQQTDIILRIIERDAR